MEKVPCEPRPVLPMWQPPPEELALDAELELPRPELLCPELPPLLPESLDELAAFPPLLLEPPPPLELWPALPPEDLLELLLAPALEPALDCPAPPVVPLDLVPPLPPPVLPPELLPVFPPAPVVPPLPPPPPVPVVPPTPPSGVPLLPPTPPVGVPPAPENFSQLRWASPAKIRYSFETPATGALSLQVWVAQALAAGNVHLPSKVPVSLSECSSTLVSAAFFTRN